MRILYYIFLLIVSSTSLYPGGIWNINTIHPSGSLLNTSKNAMYAVNDSTLFIRGERIYTVNGEGRINFYIRITQDGGKTLTNLLDVPIQDSLFGYKLASFDYEVMPVFFFPPSTIQIAPLSKPVMFTSVDLGKSWQTKTIKLNVPVDSIRFFRMRCTMDSSRQVCELISKNNSPDIAYCTHDGWKTYDTLTRPLKNGFNWVYMLSDSEFVCISGLRSFYSKDYGKTWKIAVLPAPYSGKIYADYASIIPEKHMLFLAGYHIVDNYCNSIIWKSSDAGATWKVVLYSEDKTMNGLSGMISVSPSGVGLALGERSKVPGPYYNKPVIYMTKDYGESWERGVFNDTLKNFGSTYNCAAGSINNMWAYIAPYLYKYESHDTLKVDDQYLQDFSISQLVTVYPNPLKRGSSLHLNLSALQSPSVTIKVYGIKGELFDSYTAEGSPADLLYTPEATLPTGAYYLLIETLNNRIIKNFVVE